MRRFRPALSIPLSVILVMLIGRSALAQTIVVVRPEGSDAMLTESFSRLCGELRMYGLNVTPVDKPGVSALDEPPTAFGGPAGVIGGVALVRGAGLATAKIWIPEKSSSKESVRITVSVDDADAPSLLAIRAADLVRASLREVNGNKVARSEPQPGADTVAATAANAPSTRGGSRWSIQGGAALLWEIGKLGPGGAASIGIGRSLSSRLALSLSIQAPLLGQAYSAVGATARIRQELATLALAWRFLSRKRLTLDLFQGFGAVHMSVRGEAPSPWIAQTATGWTAASSTGAFIGVPLSAHVGVTVSMSAVLLLPRPVLDVAGVSYMVHQPMLLATAGFRYEF
jgi:hypothetical protein